MGSLDQFDPWAHEKEAWAEGYANVAGVDEVGRGPLAGPVVAAAVVLPRDFCIEGITDSKCLTAAAREKADERIRREALGVGVGIIAPETIDKINILNATHQAMKAALDELGAAFDFILIDGLSVTGFAAPSRGIVKGDFKSVSIGAASIVAKVARDAIMCELDALYPEYGFASHKGYCSKVHLEALRRCGPCPCHRRSFAPVAERISQCALPGLE